MMDDLDYEHRLTEVEQRHEHITGEAVNEVDPGSVKRANEVTE